VRTRWWLLGAGLVALFAALVFLRNWGVGKVEQALQSRECTWESRRDDPLAVRWRDIACPGGLARQISIRADWPIDVRVDGPQVDLQAWLGRSRGEAGPSTSNYNADIRVEDMTVLWGERILLDGLSGPVRPEPDLSGPDGTLKMVTGPDGTRAVIGAMKLELNLPELQGEASVSVRAASTIQAELRMPAAVIRHPLLAKEPLPSQPMRLHLDWTPHSNEVALQGTVGEVPISATGTIQPAAHTIDLVVDVPASPLSEVVALFGSSVPEAGAGRFSGQLGLTAKVAGPPWRVEIAPTATDLVAKGVLPRGFRSQMIQWNVLDASGNPTSRQIGPAHPDWTPLGQASRVPEAVVAAEDGAFHSHPGFDLRAIQEALAQAKAGERLRGGSTLTQQLAKNLFLSGERTLARKLRELLYALDLEGNLSKSALLALYINVVEFGPGIYGIRAAADEYFLKQPHGLSLKEAAFLASILPRPRSAHAQARLGKAHHARVLAVLDRMAAQGVITGTQRDQARDAPLRFVLR